MTVCGWEKEYKGAVVGFLGYITGLSPVFQHMQQWFAGTAAVEASFSVHIVGMHLYFNGFSDEAIHVSGFSREDFCVLESDVVILIATVTHVLEQGSVLR